MNKFGKSLRSGGSIDYLSFTDAATPCLSKWLLKSDEEVRSFPWDQPGWTHDPQKKLKLMFESIGLENGQTCIQSGNVIFESKENDPALLEKRIERQLEKSTGKKIRLSVRMMRQVQSIAN